MDSFAILLLGNMTLLAAVLLLQPLWRDIRHGIAYTLGNFDDRRPETVFERRLSMVVRNQIESIALLLPALFVLGAAAPSSLVHYACLAHVGARVAYAFVALAGVPVLRSAFWTVGFGAWGVIAWSAVKSAL